MKKLILLSISLPFLNLGCNTDALKKQNTVSPQYGQTSNINAKTTKISVLHNGHIINIGAPALKTHLNHGDKITDDMNKFVLQGFAQETRHLDINDPVFLSLRNSSDFLSYNSAKFGDLDLNKAIIVKVVNDFEYIAIPSTITKGGSKTFLMSFSNPNQTEFNMLVGNQNLIENSSTEVGGLNLENISGDISFFSPTGDDLVKIKVINNAITSFFVTPNGDLPPFSNCFNTCYKNVRDECSSSFGCSLFCALTGEIPCILATAACCSMNCSGNGGDPCV